jgi:hypothetical protein
MGIKIEIWGNILMSRDGRVLERAEIVYTAKNRFPPPSDSTVGPTELRE